jgi:molecular chaperone GrpE
MRSRQTEAGAAPDGDDPTTSGRVESSEGTEAEPGTGAADAREAPEGDDIARFEAERELGALRDRHLRLAAEFDNYRRRTDRERAESADRAQAQLVGKLLDALDDLQRVAAHMEETPDQALLEGVRMVERKVMRALEGAGLESVAPDGEPFDPEVHEAIATVAAETREEDDTVSDVFQKGYRFRGILLRPARVRVKKHEG